MSKIFKFLAFSVIVSGSFPAFSQSYINSPYSRFGIGDIERSGFGMNRALGGLSVSLREQNQVNYLNPASHNAQDTMSFIWDVGTWGNYATSRTATNNVSKMAFNINHISMSFPILKNYYASAGLVPFSSTGYNMQETTIDSYYNRFLTVYSGSGNVNQFYIANSVGLFKKQLNLGVNFSYLFGSLNNNVEYFYPDLSYSTKNDRSSTVSGVYLNFGAQQIITVNKNIQMVAGLTFAPKTKISVEHTEKLYNNFSPTSQEVLKDSTTNGNFIIPGLFGIGVSAKFKDKLLVGLDYYYQDWTKATFLGKNDSLLKNNRLSFGVQFVPDRSSFRSYFERVNYRAGAYINSSFLNIKGQNINDYGVSFGLGLPFRNNGTMFHIGVELGKRGTTSNNLIEIDYTRFTLGVTLYDYWFYKRKID